MMLTLILTINFSSSLWFEIWATSLRRQTKIFLSVLLSWLSSREIIKSLLLIICLTWLLIVVLFLIHPLRYLRWGYIWFVFTVLRVVHPDAWLVSMLYKLTVTRYFTDSSIILSKPLEIWLFIPFLSNQLTFNLPAMRLQISFSLFSLS